MRLIVLLVRERDECPKDGVRLDVAVLVQLSDAQCARAFRSTDCSLISEDWGNAGQIAVCLEDCAGGFDVAWSQNEHVVCCSR